MVEHKRFQILDSFAIKWIAIASMVIDHFGSIVMDGVVAPYMTNDSIIFTADMPFFVRYTFAIKNVCEVLGSIGFPLFCFLLAEGFVHTRNRLTYGIRMGIFALISEIPFDLAHYQQALNFSLQNVMFTLCVGIFTLWAVSQAEEKLSGRKPLQILCIVLSVAAGCALAFLLRSEYVFLGILAIAPMYLLRKNPYLRLLGIAPLLIVSPWVLLALIPIFLYSGRRGKGSKYFFYVFYPAHFLAFAGIAYLLANR